MTSSSPGGSLPTMEWLEVEDGMVRSIWLLTDHIRWPAALEELGRRAAARKAL